MQNRNVTSSKHDVALLVHSCDRYELLYKGFEFFFSKYWNSEVNCQFYFATEEKKISINGFINIQSGKGEWADRLTLLLKEKIKEKYILYIQEDMWFSKEINSEFLNQIFELAQKNSWQQVKLHSTEVYNTIETRTFIEGFNIAKSDFLMSHQITLWNKDFLLKQLYKKEHPWRNEIKATKRLKKINPTIYQIDYFAVNGCHEINMNKSPILRSEYQSISVNGVLNYNVKPFIEVLMNEDLSLQEYALKLDHNFKNKITHDGYPKPRKVDIFKRTKDWLLGNNSR